MGHALIGHSRPVFDVAMDNSGTLALTAAGDKSLRFWFADVSRDGAPPQCLASYDYPGIPWTVDMGPLGHYFAAGGSDFNACLYSTDRTERLRVFGGHTSDVNAVCWHPNGLSVLSASSDRSARMFDIREGKCVRSLQRGSGGGLVSAAVSKDGSLLACGSESGAVTVWDLPTGQRLATLEGHTGPVHSLSFRQSRNKLVTGGEDCTVRFWDLAQAADAYQPDSLLRPASTHFTKQSPVYFVGCTPSDMLMGGGPYSITAGQDRFVKQLSADHQAAALGVSVIPPPPEA